MRRRIEPWGILMTPLMLHTEQTLSLFLWNTCNAKCQHCLLSSSPTDMSALEESRVCSLIEEAFELYGGGMVPFNNWRGAVS